MYNTQATESKTRLEVLRELLKLGTASTQEEICEALKRRKFDVTQSTVSRDLRRVGAVKATGAQGETIYRLAEEKYDTALTVNRGFTGLLRSLEHNESMIVIHTPPGSASLVARHLDAIRPDGMIGTIAGDDTVFVAATSSRQIQGLIRFIRQEFASE